MKQRSLVFMLVMFLITFGIYPIYWYCSFQNQLKKQTGEGFGGFGHLMATIFTFGIYFLVWNYKAGKRLNKLGADDWSLLFLLLPFVVVGGFVNPILMQYQANNLK